MSTCVIFVIMALKGAKVLEDNEGGISQAVAQAVKVLEVSL